MDGGKHGKRHRCVQFTPQKAAANTRAATVVTHRRRQYGTMALLRRRRHCMATIREAAAIIAVWSTFEHTHYVKVQSRQNRHVRISCSTSYSIILQAIRVPM